MISLRRHYNNIVVQEKIKILFVVDHIENGGGCGGQEVLGHVLVAVPSGPVKRRLSLGINRQQREARCMQILELFITKQLRHHLSFSCI